MKRIAILTALLALLVSGVSFAAGTPAADCRCGSAPTTSSQGGLTPIELSR
ncbi:MAG: hypothetical protein ACYDA8_17485 [Deferrisomatales bacterium]